jgi:hypothetical protein
LGRAGNELATILKQGEGAILDQLDAADKYGQVLSEDTMVKLEKASDTLETFNRNMKINSAEIISNFAPAIDSITDALIPATQKIGEFLKTYTSAAEISGKIIGGQSLESIRTDNAIDYAKTLEIDKQKDYLFNLRQLKLEKIEAKEAEISQKQLEVDNARNTGFKRLADARTKDLEKLKSQLFDLEGQSLRLKNALKGAFATDETGTTGTTTGSDSDATNAQLKRHDKNLQKMYEDTKKWGEEQAKLHWEARQNELTVVNEQYQKTREYMYADAQARFEILSESQQLLSDTRISMIESESEREIVLLDQKYDTLRTKAAGNAEALKNIEQSYAIEKNRINDMVLKNQIENAHAGMRSMSGNLETMAGEWKGFAVAYKPIAIAQATWDTYNSANAAYKAMAGIPVVGPGLGIAAAATAIGAGLANVNSIIKTKFASGTMYAPEGWSLVGEQGPELRYITQGTTIYNNRETKQMMNNSNIHVHLYDNNRNQTMELVQQIESGDSDSFIRSIKNRMQVVN